MTKHVKVSYECNHCKKTIVHGEKMVTVEPPAEYHQDEENFIHYHQQPCLPKVGLADFLLLEACRNVGLTVSVRTFNDESFTGTPGNDERAVT